MTSLSLMKWHKASLISSHELTSIGECGRCAFTKGAREGDRFIVYGKNGKICVFFVCSGIKDNASLIICLAEAGFVSGGEGRKLKPERWKGQRGGRTFSITYFLRNWS